jgi:hypothetical protein
VRLTAAHRLGQFEDSLIRFAGQTQQTFSEKLIHAVGDEVAREELAAVARVIDEVCEVLDPLAHPVVADDGIEPAGLLDRLDHERAPLLFLVSSECGIAMPCCSQ